MKTQELDLPSHWASYLINGDASGLSAEERAECDACIERQAVGRCVDCSEEEFFSRSHDARCVEVLSAMCLTYTFEVTK